MTVISDVMETEQHHFEKSPYRFSHESDRYNDMLHNDGMGEPVGNTGMSWQGFRPSDDAVDFGYNIPGNIFAAVALDYAAELLQGCAPTLAARAEALRGEILTACGNTALSSTRNTERFLPMRPMAWGTIP